MLSWLSPAANSFWRISGSAVSTPDINQAKHSILTNNPAGLNALLPEAALAAWCLYELNSYYFMV